MLNSIHFLSFLFLLLLLLLLLACSIAALTPDGVSLLSFKYAVLSDPLAALANWDYTDDTPCSWNGVVCAEFPAITDSSSSSSSRVIGLSLPNAQLQGAVSPELVLIEHLRRLDLSGNPLNGMLPSTIADDARELQLLNLSGNALTGPVPAELALLPNLTTLSLANNYFYGELPTGVSDSLEVFDVSSNLINGSLPPGLGAGSLRYLNLSHNRISGTVPPELGSALPANAAIDLSFNDLTGPIPQTGAFAAQNAVAFSGNPGLCGAPLVEKCAISSSLSGAPPNSFFAAAATPPVSKAFAAIPDSPNADSLAENGGSGGGRARPGGLRPTTIFAIAAGDFVGIGALFIVFLYIYQVKKRKHESEGIETKKAEIAAADEENARELGVGSFSCCFKKSSCGCSGDGDGTEENSETSTYSAAEAMEGDREQKATLVTVDGETEIELETLLKATAYVVGAAERGIVYKAVLVNGAAYAVRRIGEGSSGGGGSSTGKFAEFDANVRAVAKLRHRNVLRLRGFYWGPQEKLLIHDFAPNGGLNNYSLTDKQGSPSQFHLSFETRLRIARGVARGLAFLHDKKHVHGSIKPSNILLDADMEPLIGDFGLDRLVSVDSNSSSSSSSKRSMSARIFGSKWSTANLPDQSSPFGGSSSSSATPYHSPEMTQHLKPNAKSDVYSFGVVLLELIAGRVLSEVEVCQWESGFAAPEGEKRRAMRTVDPAMRGAAEGREAALLSCFKLGFSCCTATPQKRPAMKDVLQVLERISI